MNRQITLTWQLYWYFTYERRLAEREVESLLRSQPLPVAHGLQVTLPIFPKRDIDRLTYFRAASLNGTVTVEPLQARLEASARLQSASKSAGPRLSLARQSTRYSAHGLHEYRGKFNPQIVRAVLNLVGA